eukprot:TRINITY_DN5973_c0_g1_i1.p1 TRINITY_DN5973_c0_g1~~TRINITY_DN5973_c0_g1_i1.p1  ORF type:complete len:1272 (+),score=276.08 TRINITY_DN5973_c0_g1_i1:97-3912(+)
MTPTQSTQGSIHATPLQQNHDPCCTFATEQSRLMMSEGTSTVDFGDPVLALEGLKALQQMQAHFKGDTAVAAALAQLAGRERSFSLTAFVAQTLTNFYRELAVQVLRHSKLVMIIVAVCVGLAIVSWQLLLSYEDDSAALWTPQDSEAYTQLTSMRSHFGRGGRPAVALFHRDGEDILTHEFLYALLDYHSLVFNEARWHDFCYRPLAPADCVKASLLDAWGWNRHRIEDDENLHDTLEFHWGNSRGNVTDGWRALHAVDWSEPDLDGHRTLLAVRATQAYWAYGNEDPSAVLGLEDVFISIFSDRWPRDHPEYKATAVARSSTGKEIARVVSQDILLVAISIALVMLFCTLVLGDRTLVGNRLLLGFFAIMCMLLAFVIGMGILSLTGQKETPITPLVLFVLIGIGVDDCIIIVDAHNSHFFIRDPVRRLSRSLSVAGPAITLTTLTDILAFAFGAAAEMPAVRSFSLTALFVILVDFVLQVTLFLVALDWDQRRIDDNRMDCCFCIEFEDRYTSLADVCRGGANAPEPTDAPPVLHRPSDARTSILKVSTPHENPLVVGRPVPNDKSSTVDATQGATSPDGSPSATHLSAFPSPAPSGTNWPAPSPMTASVQPRSEPRRVSVALPHEDSSVGHQLTAESSQDFLGGGASRQRPPMVTKKSFAISVHLPIGGGGGGRRLSSAPSFQKAPSRMASAVTGRQINAAAIKRLASRRVGPPPGQRRPSGAAPTSPVEAPFMLQGSDIGTALTQHLEGATPGMAALTLPSAPSPAAGEDRNAAVTQSGVTVSSDTDSVPETEGHTAVTNTSLTAGANAAAARGMPQPLPCVAEKPWPSDPGDEHAESVGEDEEETRERTGPLQRCLRDFYAPVICHPHGRTAIILVFLGWLIFCALHISKIEKGLCDTCVLPEDSYIITHVDARDRYYGDTSETVYVVIEDDRLDWRQQATTDAMDNLRRRMEANPSITSFKPWIHDFLAWANFQLRVAKAGSELWLNAQEPLKNIYWLLPLFWEKYPEATTQVRVNATRHIVVTRSFAEQRYRDGTWERIDDMNSIRATFAEWSRATGVRGYVVSGSWPFSDGDAAIEGLIFSTLWLTCLAVFVSLLLFVSPVISLLITLNVAAIDTSILGWMYLVEISMSPVSYIVIAMSVGMAVDYCAHVGIAFASCRVNARSQSMLNLLGGHEEAVRPDGDAAYYARIALEEIGASVFAGGTSTLLGVVALAGASSATFFTFFLMMFGTIVFGMLHGFVFFPAVLASLPQGLVRKVVIAPL